MDLSIESNRKSIARKLANEIDRVSVELYEEGHRNHLGASIIGDDCSRKLWYMFRWVKKQKFSGRMYRLFNRGHREEPVLINYLRKIGFKVSEFCENGKQHRISEIGGHFGGSLDAIIEFPKSWNIPGEHLGEFKTIKDGADYSNFEIKGMKEVQPKHWSQTCTYGYLKKLKYLLYFSVNKNNDNIYIEIQELDWDHGKQMVIKAHDIISSQIPLDKIASVPTYYKCKFCEFTGVCHNGEDIEKNCRSCAEASPSSNGRWHCNEHSDHIPEDFIKLGCDYWRPIA